MAFQRFPRIELTRNIQRMLMVPLVISGLVAYFGAIYEGVSWKSWLFPMDKTLAGFLFYGLIAVLLLYLYQVIRMKPFTPAVIIDSSGFHYIRYSRETIPWSCIAEVALSPFSSKLKGYRFSSKVTGNILEILLTDNVSASIRAQVESMRWLNFRNNGLVMTIVPGAFKEMSTEQIASVLISYQKEFGSGTPQ
jgi:hypothetical protein